MTVLLLSTLLTLVVLPLAALYWFYRGSTSLLLWLAKAAAVGGYIVATFYAGPWHMLSYYGRYALVAVFAGVFLHEAWHMRQWSSLFPSTGWNWLEALVAVGLIAVVGTGLTSVYRSHEVPSDPVELAFPLENGTYYVASGGSQELMNPHLKVAEPRFAKWRGQMWGLDIVGLYDWGNRARGLYPTELTDYAIYGEPLYAPCDAHVEAAEGSLPDLVPPARDTTHKAGNYVLLECQPDAYILLAHLKNGSLTVQPGDHVATGDRIGVVGNSGNSWEPHLHISAQQSPGRATVIDADPRPVTFDGEFLVRNDVVWTRAAQ